MKIIYLIIVGLLISGMSYSQLIVKKVTSEVALDGVIEETFWDISNQITLGNSNNTANFGVLWDDDYLYVGIDVEDATLCTNKRQGFYDDGIEICINGNNSQGTNFDDYDRIFVKPIRSYWIQEMEQRFDGVIHKWIETADGYSMEFAIPWTNFDITPAVGANIGFNIIVNDDENCSYQFNMPNQLFWAGNSNYYNDPSVWGTISLSSETVSYSSDYISILNPNGGNFCINNKITPINWVSNGLTNIDIDYSIDNGSTWNSVVTNLAASSGSYNWNVSASPNDNCLLRISETGNQSLNDISINVFTISASLTPVEPLIPNTWKNYQWPYNAYFPEDPNGINGHIGNACGPSSLARILHYWEFPIVGNDELTFIDNGGTTWSANFGETTYNYDNMPNYLPENSTEPEYTDVATLTYHAATSMHDIYGSGMDLATMSYGMSQYFNYKESTPTIRSGYTKAEWINILINELDNGRVLLIDGMTAEFIGDWHESNSVAGHWFHIDGYNEDGHFHGVLGFSDEDAWFDIDNLFGYYLNNGILVGLEPNLNGKELSLQTHNDGEIIQANQVSQINWSSTGVANIRIEYTVDNGQNWSEIISSTSATTGTYNWTVPNFSSDECKIKLTDTENINVYDKSNEVFSISLYELELTLPNGGEYYIPGDLISIIWEQTLVSNIKIEYTANNGSNWIEIATSASTESGYYDWIIPSTISDQCKIRITDISNNTIYDENNSAFEIGLINNIGGPYAVDENTILLLHFEGDFKNQSSLSDDGIPHGDGISFDTNTPSLLGKCLKLDNNNSSAHITVPHNPNLNLTDDWTIEAWVYIESFGSGASTNPTIISKSSSNDQNYFLWYHNNWGQLKGQYTNTSNTDKYVGIGGSITSGQWYHIAYIKNTSNSTESLLIHDQNMVLIAEETVQQDPSQTNPIINNEDVYIGKLMSASSFFFDGYIDELRISNIVREYNGVSPFIALSPNHANVSANAGSIDFVVNCPDDLMWDITGLEAWLSATPLSGTGTGTVTLDYEGNTNSSSRTDDFTVSGEGETETFTFTQNGTPYLSIDPTSEIVDASSGATTTLLTSNTSWIVTDVAMWYTVSPMSGTGDATLTITYDENLSTSSHTDDFTISGEGETAVFSLTQNGATPSLGIDPASATVDSSVGSTNALLTTNVSWTVTNVEDWYTVLPMSGSGNATLTVTYEENELLASRIDDFTISGEGETATFTLTQNGANAFIVLSPDQANVSPNSGTLEISVDCPEDLIWEITGLAGWLSATPLSGTGPETVNLDYEENTNPDSRTDDFAISGNGATEVFTITQVGAGSPTADFSADPLWGTQTLTTQFTDLSIPGNNLIVSWNWDFGDGEASGEQHPEHTYDFPGIYTISLTVSDGNISDTKTETDYISVYEEFIIDSGDDLDLDVGQGAYFQGSYSGGSGDVIHEWSGVNNSVFIANPNSLTSYVGEFDIVDVYYFVISGSDNITGEMKTDTMFIDVVLGMEDVIRAEDIKVYPNPTTGNIIIEALEKPEMISIISMTGRELIHLEKLGKSGLYNSLLTRVDLSNLPSGIYFIGITFKSAYVIKKVDKQ